MRAKTGIDLWVLPLQGDRKPVLLLGTEFNEGQGVFSPDMRWIAYTSNESGRNEVYVRPFLVSGPSGRLRSARANGKSLRTVGAIPNGVPTARKLSSGAPPNGIAKMAVDVKANGAAFEAGIPQRLFLALPDFGWDVTSDGKRFLHVRAPSRASRPPRSPSPWYSTGLPN